MSERTALLIIDAQVGLIEGSRGPVFKADLLLENLKSMLNKAREANVSVIYIQDDDVATVGSSEWEIHPSISPIKGELVIRKKATDAFYGTNLDERLKSKEITKLVVGGCKTEYCVDTTCRKATTLGYNVILVGDAHSTTDNKVLTAEQIIAHHNCNLHGLDNLENYIEVMESKDVEFFQS